MKKIYVDTENISNYKCLELLNITKKDEITLFLTQNTKPLKAESLNIILGLTNKVKTLMFKVQKQNALDFHIVSFLGRKYTKRNEYFIISNDKGFETVQEHYALEGLNNVHIIGENTKFFATGIDELEIKRLLKESKNKADFHNLLVKKYGENGKLAYQEYKKCAK